MLARPLAVLARPLAVLARPLAVLARSLYSPTRFDRPLAVLVGQLVAKRQDAGLKPFD